MKSIYFRKGLFMLVLPFMFFTSFTNKGGNVLVIIVNQNNPIGTIPASQVKVIYLRKISRRWKELNKNILPVDRKTESESKTIFLKEILQMTKTELDSYFSEREYQNQETPPVKFSYDNDIVNYVEENPGAIGFVMSNAIEGNNNVKVICTINH